jgi:hypothetical protein
VGEAALLPLHGFGQLLEPLPAVLGIGERDEDLVVGAGQLGVRLQVTFEDYQAGRLGVIPAARVPHTE